MKKISVIGLSGSSVFLTVDHFHENGETLSASSLFEEAGGKGFNQAVAAKRLGCSVCYLTATGKDKGADLCEATLKDEGINAYISRKDEGTAFAAILTDKSGENKVTVYRGAELEEKDVSAFEKEIASSALLLLQLEVPVEVNVAAALTAMKYNVPYILNPAPMNGYDEKIGFLCENAEFITPNEQEAKKVFGTDSDDINEIYKKFRESAIKRAIVTLGDKGCAVMTKNVLELIPAFKVDAIDTTGAGDVFNGAFCVKLCRDLTLIDDLKFIKECAEYAQAASAFSVRHSHVLGSIPHKTDLE